MRQGKKRTPSGENSVTRYNMHTQALEAKLEEAEHEVEIDRSLTPIQLWE